MGREREQHNNNNTTTQFLQKHTTTTTQQTNLPLILRYYNKHLSHIMDLKVHFFLDVLDLLYVISHPKY